TVQSIPQYVGRTFRGTLDSPEVQGRTFNAALCLEGTEPKENYPSWHHQRLLITFKTGGAAFDPFDDSPTTAAVPSPADTRAHVRRQILASIGRAFLYRIRTALFSLFILDSTFRFLRWDRSGVFVTEKMDYVKDPTTLIKLLTGFLMLDSESQGVDLSVRLIPEATEEWEEMKRVGTNPNHFDVPELSYEPGSVLPDDVARHPKVPISPEQNTSPLDVPPERPVRHTQRPVPGSFIWAHAKLLFARSLDESWPWYAIELDGEQYWVGRPLYQIDSVVSRGTRGYVAYNPKTRRFCFLKDTWRWFHEDRMEEGAVLRTLNQARVRHVPTLVAHGYPGTFPHTTRVADHLLSYCTLDEGVAIDGRPPKRRAPRDDNKVQFIHRHAHYRIVVEEVCLPLDVFRSSRQLLSIIRDSMEAESDAIAYCKLIHGDISSGNILICPGLDLSQDGHLRVDWFGMLNDWELARYVSNTASPQRTERMGTFKYMSLATLSDPKHVVTVADEIESHANVLLYNGVKYLPHNVSTESFLKDYFGLDWSTPETGDLASNTRWRIAKLGELLFGETLLLFGKDGSSNLPLNTAIGLAFKWIGARARIRDYENKKSKSLAQPRDIPAPSQRLRLD
ncbi:uncharacterized protein BXZ73DRAFT_22769, partial [Epithele typhae]|uniref:uncharacterized protein n=1 Tax=Epithele typhae TaxID=378194 RepID=UPI002008899C